MTRLNYNGNIPDTDLRALFDAAQNRINSIDAFLAIADPTAVQVRDEVRRLAQTQRRIILALQKFIKREMK